MKIERTLTDGRSSAQQTRRPGSRDAPSRDTATPSFSAGEERRGAGRRASVHITTSDARDERRTDDDLTD